uniref:Uncharacterized protein n=1 Tax=Anguilla anguilla TaxID=7936 RepID=A0A0E9UF16_ANGAN
MPFGNTHNNFKLNFTVEEEYPDLSQHNNHMAKSPDQGDLRQAEGQTDPQRLHSG